VSTSDRAGATNPLELLSASGKPYKVSEALSLHILILSFLISSFDQVSLCLSFKKIVWKTWSSSGLSLSSWYWKLEQSKHISYQISLGETLNESNTYKLAGVLGRLFDEVHPTRQHWAPEHSYSFKRTYGLNSV
jgi:hypothetical protein